MSDRFLPKNPVASIDAIKEDLYARLNKLRNSIKKAPSYGVQDEIEFLVDLIDRIERS